MTIVHTLLKMPPMAMLALFVGVFSTLGALGTYLFRKYSKVNVQASHNEVTGNIFAMVGGFYGLLLAFVVFLVWDQFNSAQSSADVEASLARGLYRDIKFYPVEPDDTLGLREKNELTFSFVTYVKTMLKEDSIMNATSATNTDYLRYRDTLTVKAFNKVFEVVECMHDDELYKNQRIDQMFRHLNELATYRSLRGMAADSEIGLNIWIPLWFGGLITAIFAILMDIENRRLHVIMNGLLGGFVAMIFYIIVLIDHPFEGATRIDIGATMGKIMSWENSGMMETQIPRK